MKKVCLFMLLSLTSLYAHSQTVYDWLRLTNGNPKKGILEFGVGNVIFENSVSGSTGNLLIKTLDGTSTVNTMFLKSNGNIGLGTITPLSKLDVVATMPGLGTFDHQHWNSGNPAYHLKLQTTWNSSGIFQKIVQRFSNTDYTALSFFQGNLGVGGVDAPLSKLDVGVTMPGQGTYDVQHWSAFNPAYHLKLQTTWDNGGISQKFVQRFANVNYTTLAFFQGNVGIGIDNASTIDAKLAVKGHIHAQEVRVDLSGAVAPDYVFAKDYELMPLNEVKAYIDQNSHLPEVPSAADMERDGVLLKEMNLTLLKKVEELTLHAIELNKTNQEQSELLKNLQRKTELLEQSLKALLAEKSK